MAPSVDTYALGPTQTNCYVVRARPDAQEAVVIDPGYEVAAPDSKVAGILVTHCHWDHLGGIAPLATATGAPVYMAEREASVLEDPAAFYPDQQIPPYRADVRLEGGDTIEAAGLTFDVVDVAGLSPAHIASATDGMLVSGGSFSARSFGRTDLPSASAGKLVDSSRARVD